MIWAGEIFFLNPLPRSTNFPELEKAITRYFSFNFVLTVFNTKISIFLHN